MNTPALRNKPRLHRLGLALLSAFVAALVIEVVFLLAISRGEIAESGMWPHFARGDRILVDRLSPALVDYRPGEVVGTNHAGKNFGIGALSRVIAVPGTKVGRSEPILLGADEYLLAAVKDQAGYSDPATVMVVARSSIHGRVILRTYPLARFEWLPGLVNPKDASSAPGTARSEQ